MKTLKIQISNGAFELLKEINNLVYIEYRDNEFLDINEFKKSKTYLSGYLTVEYFKKRNHNGTLSLIYELMEYNLVTDYEDSWYASYKITEIGKQLLKINK